MKRQLHQQTHARWRQMQLELVAVVLVLPLWCSGDRHAVHRAGALLVGGIALLGDVTAAGCSW